MAKSREIELADGTVIPILYEDRSVLALDKPAGWLMVPTSWEKTGRNLQLALESSINARDFWARSRNLRFLRFVHRLDAETSGVVLFVRSPGAMRAYSELFESRDVGKTYLAVVQGVPKPTEWKCAYPVVPVAGTKSRMQAVTTQKRVSDAKEAETVFRVLKAAGDTALLEARPLTGRTHQIRVHLAASGYPVVGDSLYARSSPQKSGAVPPHSKTLREFRQVLERSGTAPLFQPLAADEHLPLALRAIGLAYRDPFTRKSIRISAPFAAFVRQYGFELKADELFRIGDRPMKAE